MQLKLKNVVGKIDVIDERVETTEQQLTAFVNSTTQEIETLTANMTNEIAVLESEAIANITSLSSDVSSVSTNLASLSSTVDANKISNATIDERIDLRSPRFSSSKTLKIYLWNMAGKFPAKKV